MNCRVCGLAIDGFVLSLPAPGLTSLTTRLDAPTQVAVCTNCGHGQSPEPVALDAFYDSEYRISLQSDDFDQLHSIEDGTPVYRTDRQVEVLLKLVAVADGAKVLDYGAAKAQSLKRLLRARPGIVPHVFDVSNDYRDHWQGWLPGEQSATYTLPDDWEGKFDLVTTYFVLEHVADPTAHLSALRKLLKKDGHVFVIVPDSLSNTGDMLIVDHINHFSRASLVGACARAGLRITGIDDTSFIGGLAIAATPDDTPAPCSPAAVAGSVERMEAACRTWHVMHMALKKKLSARRGRPFALHGAGFYGSFVMQQIGDNPDLQIVLDANPHLQGGTFFDRPVVAPEALPAEIDIVVVALNPSIARRIAGQKEIYGRHGVEPIFLDQVE